MRRRLWGWSTVIISHGYPGNRYLLSHLGENLASKGYVVASIDHKSDSTYDDQTGLASTLYNRPLDQLFVLLMRWRGCRPTLVSFLRGLVDATWDRDRRLLDGRDTGFCRDEPDWRRLPPKARRVHGSPRRRTGCSTNEVDKRRAIARASTLSHQGGDRHRLGHAERALGC